MDRHNGIVRENNDSIHVSFRYDVYDSYIVGAFGPHLAVPVPGIFLRSGCSKEEFSNFLAVPHPMSLPPECHIKVSDFMKSIGLGELETIQACRYRSIVETIMIGGLEWLRIANDHGMSVAHFHVDPVFPRLRQPTVVAAIARRCMCDLTSREDYIFFSVYFASHLIQLQNVFNGQLTRCTEDARSFVLKRVPIPYLTRQSAERIATHVLERSHDLRVTGRLLLPIAKGVLGDESSTRADRDRIVDAIPAMTDDDLDEGIKWSFTHSPEVCKHFCRARASRVEKKPPEVEAIINAVIRNDKLEALVTQLLVENMLSRRSDR